MEPVLIKTLDMLESFGFISALCNFIVGFGVSIHFYSTRLTIVSVSISTAVCIAPLFIRMFIGMDASGEPLQVNSEQVAVVEQIPVDEYTIEGGNKAHSESGFILIKAFVIVGAIPFAIGFLFVIVGAIPFAIGFLFVIADRFPVFTRPDNIEREMINQAEQRNELTSTTDLPESGQMLSAPSSSTSQSVGSLKSTRKIQLD